MLKQTTFRRRGIVEGFFGPLWSTKHRAALFEFGAKRGMNTYLYAPKDDPYHRVRWREPYPARQWKDLLGLISLAQRSGIDFVYGFHPGQGLLFSEDEPVSRLLRKAERFYSAGVRTFAVLFDDIPSHLEHPRDQKRFDHSLAAAEGVWLEKILWRQPASWRDVEWWICPSYYTEDPYLAKTFGTFKPSFLETLARYLPASVACFWTGPSVVSKKISLAHVNEVAQRIRHRLILWDNYPVNDLSMSKEMHLSPLTGRDPRLPEGVYGYLNNPLLQEDLSFIPLATCFDYAANPRDYDPERSWRRIIRERFGRESLRQWQAIREFCDRINRQKGKPEALKWSGEQRARLKRAYDYLRDNRKKKWADEFRPWRILMEESLAQASQNK